MEIKLPTLEAELLSVDLDPAKIAVYHERLERVFERKWRMLMDNRLRYAAGKQDNEEGDPAKDQIGKPQRNGKP